ncbi:Blue-light-activated histidine kinase [Ensifer sesbaniae]|nr:Blue-light-activated histidine kinase [Ensifer sesbaniae]
MLERGETVVAKDRPFYIERHGYPETVYFDISYSPVRDEKQKVRGVFCIVNETTERVKFEGALKSSEERLRAIFSQSAAGISQTDLTGRFLLVNNRFCEIVGYSEAELLTLRMHDIGASKLAHDITVRKEAERLQTVLVGELNHRVKNVFATVLAIARQTLGRSDTTDVGEVEAFEARLVSMARAHDLLTNGNWERAELKTIINQAISPYAQERFVVSGPQVQVPTRMVVSLSLALHELATNAAKYGALSTGRGRISITWSLQTGPPTRLTLRWQESGGPVVKQPSRKGFGSRLIQTLLAAELNGQVEISYHPSGLVCSVDAALQGGWDEPTSP